MQDELYDLKQDPQEVRNLIDEPAYQQIAQQLRNRLLTHYLDTSEAVPFPEGPARGPRPCGEAFGEHHQTAAGLTAIKRPGGKKAGEAQASP